MTVHPMRPPKRAKPAKVPELTVTNDGGLTISYDVQPADVVDIRGYTGGDTTPKHQRTLPDVDE